MSGDTSPLALEQAREFFIAGFKASGEGYNAEYPFHFNDEEIRDALEDKFLEAWEEYDER